MPKKSLGLLSKGLTALGVMAVSASFALTDIDPILYMTNVLAVPEHAAFDGTVTPVAKAVDWVELSSDDWDKSYDDLSKSKIIDLPWYDPSELSMSTDDLQWGDNDDDAIRNAKISFSVPYMGNYRLDGVENAGSHLAVDIKTPEGTPVRSIANGSVIKAAEKSSGFGYHIVIQHNNVPESLSGSKKGTLYSSYSHLSKIDVEVGDVVDKGDWIGKSGSTGTATTPHVHFQIDNDEAPWHPFWPFTWQEAVDEGLDFFSAVNAGLGQETALKTTVNPMKYVQKYMDEDEVEEYVEVEEEEEEVVVVEEEEEEDFEEVEAESYVEEEEEVEDEVEVIEEEEEKEVVVVDKEMVIVVKTKDTYYIGGNSDFTISLRDQFGEPFVDSFKSMKVSSVDGNVFAKDVYITPGDFDSNGDLDNSFWKMKAGNDRVEITFDGDELRFDNFKILSNYESFDDVPKNHEYADAINYLVAEGVVKGYDDNTFRPEVTVNRAEALKFILESINVDLDRGEPPFYDAKEGWYVDYLYTAYLKEIVNGNPDGTFEPGSTVNKAAFFKMLFNGMEVDINPTVTTKPYDDVPLDAWFAPYISYAKDLGIIDPDLDKIGSDAPMTRGEVADAMYKLSLELE
jgi:hypothetical protein